MSRDIAPDDLERASRDELIATIRRLQATVAHHEERLEEQAAYLRSLLHRQASAAAERRLGAQPAIAPVVPAPDPPPAGDRPPSAPASPEPATPASYTIVFDGGSLGNPGKGYGSYQIAAEGRVIAHERLDFGDRVTNNQAEYRTLIQALADLRRRLDNAAATATVIVRGDSQLVVNQTTGRWKVKHADLQPLQREAVALLKGFGRTEVIWHDRSHSVRALGH